MHEITIFELMLKLWPIILFMLCLSFAWGGMQWQVINEKKERIKGQKTIMNEIARLAGADMSNATALRDYQNETSRQLYRDHMPVFMPTAVCEKQTAACKQQHAEEEKERKETYKDIKAELETIKKEVNEVKNMMVSHLGDGSGHGRRESDKGYHNQ